MNNKPESGQYQFQARDRIRSMDIQNPHIGSAKGSLMPHESVQHQKKKLKHYNRRKVMVSVKPMILDKSS
jgi:hypothetical protein